MLIKGGEWYNYYNNEEMSNVQLKIILCPMQWKFGTFVLPRKPLLLFMEIADMVVKHYYCRARYALIIIYFVSPDLSGSSLHFILT